MGFDEEKAERGDRRVDPNRIEVSDFVNLHGHSTYSVGDAVGRPGEIVDAVMESGMAGLAMTEHGNMNSLAEYYTAVRKVRKSGRDFKPIFGNEAYFHPDLSQWARDREESRRLRAIAKASKSKHLPEMPEDDGAPRTFSDSDGTEEGAALENENESKGLGRTGWDPVKRRHHLVLLAANESGLKKLLRLNAWAHREGFYRYPRIDFRIIREVLGETGSRNRDVICTSACLAGIFSYELFRGRDEGRSDDEIMGTFENLVDRFVDTFGEERFFLEIQFNAIGRQHELNGMLVRLARKTGVPLVAAADYHYPRRDLFRVRDLVKWSALTGRGFDVTVHESVEELDCQLFPKNGREMVEAYNEMDGHDYIEANEILGAIRTSRRIADELVTNYELDASPKLPPWKGNPQRDLEAICLRELHDRFMPRVRAGRMSEKDFAAYEAQLRHELNVIRDKRFARYFLTYMHIIRRIKAEMLVGPARGSGAGCLVNYLLGITEVDPLRFGLMFERFLDEYRTTVVPRMDVF